MANNRQYRRKMHQKVDSMPTSFSGEFGKIIKILIVIVIFFVIFYFLTVYILKKENLTSITDNTPAAADIQYQEILAGTSFTKEDSHYLVLYYDMSDDNLKSLYTNMISTYEDDESHDPIYTVDMSSTFNKKYTSDKSNKNVEKLEDLQISGPTLIEFEDGEVTEYIEGEDAIREHLTA